MDNKNFIPPFSIFSLVGSRDHRTQFWNAAIQGPFHQSLVQIGPVVSGELIKMWKVNGRMEDRRRTLSGDNSSHVGQVINRYQSANETFWRADFSNAKQNILWNLCHILSIFKPLSKSILIFMIIYWFFTHRTRQMVYISADYISLNPTCN